jgi:cytidylate kinase
MVQTDRQAADDNIIMCKNVVQTDRQAADDNIIMCTRFASWITKATKKKVILIAFPLPQWFRQHALKIR